MRVEAHGHQHEVSSCCFGLGDVPRQFVLSLVFLECKNDIEGWLALGTWFVWAWAWICTLENRQVRHSYLDQNHGRPKLEGGQNRLENCWLQGETKTYTRNWFLLLVLDYIADSENLWDFFFWALI